MSNYLDLIFVGPQQAVPIIVALVLWLGLAGLGAFVTNRERLTEANVIFGWAVISGVFTVVGVFVRAPFLYLAIAFAVLAVIGIFHSIRSGQHLFIPGAWRVLVLALPLLWIAGAMDPSQWDEFSHWLPAAQYLLAINGFPNNQLPYLGAYMIPGYPFGWPMLSYLSSLIAGQFLNNISGTLNVLLLLTFSTFALRTALRVAGRELSVQINWGFAALIVLFATIFNPTFIQKIVLTAYSDVSTSVVTGFSLLLGYYFIESLAGRIKLPPAAAALQLALALSLLVNVRQSNLVLFVIIAFAVTVLALRDQEINFGAYLRYLPLAVIPAIIIYLAWRYHIVVGLGKVSNAELTLRAIDSWYFKDIPAIIAQMGVVAFKKIGFFAPMLIACGFAIRGLVRFETKFDRISVLVAVLFLGYTSFLLMMYVGYFGRTSALSVISFWRYSTHNGMVAVTFISAGLIYLFRHRLSRDQLPAWLKSVGILLVVILPFGLVHKLRFDLEPPKPHFTAVAKDIVAIVDEKSQIFILDPFGTGESGLITRYHLGRVKTGWMSAFTQPSPARIKKQIEGTKDNDYILVHSLMEKGGQFFNNGQHFPLSEKNSYLLRRVGKDWKITRSWEKPANHRN
tara:strand:- start:1294 stop:3162 length:1869 start_codon:yes stop_codon:yes gene_type:complete